MSEKKYLIRKTNFIILGPLSILEIKKMHKEERLDPLDEINKPYFNWCFINDKEEIKENYPECEFLLNI